MSIKVLLARHGSSLAYSNIDEDQDVFRQISSTPLSPDGHNEAQKLALEVYRLHPDVLLNSPYTRAQQTASTITEYNPYLFPNTIEDLGEIKRAVDGKNIYGDLNLRYKKFRGDLIRKRDLNSKFHVKDESFGQFFTRSSRVVHLIEKDFDNQSVLVVGHSQQLAMMITRMLKGEKPHPAVLFDTFNLHFMEHCALTTLEYNYRTGWKLLSFNDQKHLR